MGGEQEARGLRRRPGDEVVHEDEVAERLAHLHPVELDHRDVHPVAGERLALERLGLGDLGFVVGVDEVVAAAVDVDGMT